MEEQIPEKLYHYCSVDTLRIIAEKKTLRLSEMSKSNDSMECQWLEKKVIPDLIEALFNENPFEVNFEEISGTKEPIQKLKNLFSWFIECDNNPLNKRMVFATCLSKNGDLLSQWRGYAEDGTGVSIGFDSSILTRFKSKEPDSTFDFSKVVYKKGEQEALIREYVLKYLDTVRRHDDKEQMLDAVEELIFHALYSSARVKNEAFIEEDEWRFFLYTHNVQDYKTLKEQYANLKMEEYFSDLGVIAKSGKLVYYYDIKLDRLSGANTPLNYIKEVVLGPKCRLSIKDVMVLLSRYGWDTSQRNLKIYKSDATYI